MTQPETTSHRKKLFFTDLASSALHAVGFLSIGGLASLFKTNPDPILTQLGGSRVEVAVGLSKSMFQLEISPDDKSHEGLVAKWVRTETTARRPKATAAEEVTLSTVPLSLDSAIASLCDSFKLSKEAVIRDGVDLLAFWEGEDVGQRLELPMSTEWRKYALAGVVSGE